MISACNMADPFQRAAAWPGTGLMFYVRHNLNFLNGIMRDYIRDYYRGYIGGY